MSDRRRASGREMMMKYSYFDLYIVVIVGIFAFVGLNACLDVISATTQYSWLIIPAALILLGLPLPFLDYIDRLRLNRQLNQGS